ncbi:MAG: hypothetical protein JWN17_1025, partial [Frankiales bacterium]|nr:hypothetical protein [Frankiales bacterium]
MTAPTLAGVVLNHDYGPFLPDAVESLLRQDPPLDEVVVVDDGSTDGSLEALAPYRERVVVVAKANGGQWSACRAALDLLASDYVYFLDADDVAGASLSAEVRPVLATRPVKVQFPLQAVDGALRSLGSVFPTFPAGYDAARMRADNAHDGFYVCPPTSGNVFRVDALRALDLDAVDDREFVDGAPTLVMPYLGEVVSLQQPLALYRVHGRNHSLRADGLADLLRRECARFARRWVQARALAPLPEDPDRGPAPTYLVERRLMLAALGERGLVAPLVARYLARLARGSAPPLHRAVVAVWALQQLLPVHPARRRRDHTRRSA